MTAADGFGGGGGVGYWEFLSSRAAKNMTLILSNLVRTGKLSHASKIIMTSYMHLGKVLYQWVPHGTNDRFFDASV